jgi:hypothetical protein
LVVQSALPGPAARKPDIWVDNPNCTAGSFDTANVSVVPPNEEYAIVSIPGQLNCGGSRTTMWGTSVSAPGERTTHVLRSMLEGYAPTAPTTFQVTVPVLFGGGLIVCLHPGPRRTLACVRVSAGAGGVVTVANQPSGWPTVVSQENSEYHLQPQCNTCWTTEPL